MLQPAAFTRGYSDAKGRSLGHLTAQQTNHHALDARLRQRIGLDHDRRPRFSIITWSCHRHDISPAHQRSGSSATASIKFSASVSSLSFNRATCRRNSRANPGERGSGTQICPGRSPCARNRARYSLIFATDETDLDLAGITMNFPSNMLFNYFRGKSSLDRF